VSPDDAARERRCAWIRRFVFASTVKVNGEAKRAGAAVPARRSAAPSDAYARSKLDAERELAESARERPSHR
jgi:nucleoside-diphosphate-sugar epimerase